MFIKKKMKTYPMSAYGRAKMELDIEKEKQAKMNNILSILFLLVFFSFGLLSKEYLLLYLTSKGVNFITKIFL